MREVLNCYQRKDSGNDGELPVKLRLSKCVVLHAVRVPIKVVACSAVFTYEWLTFLCSQLIPALPLFCLAYPIHVTLPFSDSPVLQRLRWASQREALAENRGGWSLEPCLPTSDCLRRATVAASYLRVLPQES